MALQNNNNQDSQSGLIAPRWWRWWLVLPLVIIVFLSISYSVSVLNTTKQRVENKQTSEPVNQQQAWYLQQEAPTPSVNLSTPKALFPESDGVTGTQVNRAYEEPLPTDLYELAPVVSITSGIADIAKITQVLENGATRVVIPEEFIPQDIQDNQDNQDETVDDQTEPETVISGVAEIASLEPEATPQIPDIPQQTRLQQWQQFALPFVIPATAPMIAIVIDDMGVDQRRSRRATTLPGPLTLSYLTYASDIINQTRDARSAGHELMLHVPMQPGNASIDPGPNFLNTANSSTETLRRLRWGMEKFEGYVGLNNHMGSRFTQYKDGMRVVLNEVRRRGLLFLDSRTSGGSVGAEIARETGVTFASRNVFLDHVDDRDSIRKQLAQSERLALRNGSVIAIGHPRDATLDVLKEWLPTLAAKGFVLAPISAIVIRSQQQAMQASVQ